MFYTESFAHEFVIRSSDNVEPFQHKFFNRKKF